MATIKLANGTAVKEIRIWTGAKWEAKRGRVYAGAKWQDFIRPIITFKDTLPTRTGMSTLSNTGVISGGKLIFATSTTYSIK